MAKRQTQAVMTLNGPWILRWVRSPAPQAQVLGRLKRTFGLTAAGDAHDHGHLLQGSCSEKLYPLVMTNIAMENDPFIVDFP